MLGTVCFISRIFTNFISVILDAISNFNVMYFYYLYIIHMYMSVIYCFKTALVGCKAMSSYFHNFLLYYEMKVEVNGTPGEYIERGGGKVTGSVI